MDKNHRRPQILEGNEEGDSIAEILDLARIIHPDIDIHQISRINDDVTAIFNGTFPGFRVSNPTYHNLRHTRLVVLAVNRLFHGLWISGRTFDAETLIQGLLSAFFHDTGMLLSEADNARTGAHYIKGHEKRSISFLQRYVEATSLPLYYAENCAAIIRCTELYEGIDHIHNMPEEIQLAGHIVGAADILSQMADRYYLERLPLLFQEQKDGKAHEYNTPLELMQSTADFYRTTVSYRLHSLFSDVSHAMRNHFRARWQINEDLYTTAILKNISYLESIIVRCKAEQECVKRHLRRIPPTSP
jgi:hypothetical protein